MLIKKCFLFLFSFIFFDATLFADTSDLEKYFSDVFYTSMYQPRKCGSNIEALIRSANLSEDDLTRVNVLRIVPIGMVHIEGLKAYNARDRGRLIDQPGGAGENSQKTFPHGSSTPTRVTGTAIWYFHVVAESDGKILDFDYTNQPTIISAASYFKDMFYPDQGRTGYEASPNFPGRVQDDYIVEIVPAADLLEERRSMTSGARPAKKEYQKMTLKKYLERHWYVEANAPAVCASALEV